MIISMLDNISNVDSSVMLQVESMKKKLPWLKYDMKKAEYMEAKEQEKDAKKKLDEAAKTLNDLKEPIEYDDLSLVHQICSA